MGNIEISATIMDKGNFKIHFIFGFLSLVFSWPSYSSQCNDDIDNDGDGLVDFGYDISCVSEEDDTEAGLNFAVENGWSNFEPSTDTRIVYVSSSEGSDRNDGLSQKNAKATIAAGKALLRDEFPDWLLLKRGDQWDEVYGQIRHSGRSATEPTLLGAYGDASEERPRMNAGGNRCWYSEGSKRGPDSTDNIVILEQYCYKHTRDPDNPAFSEDNDARAMYWLRGTTLLHLEDVVFRFGQLSFQDIDRQGIDNVTFNRVQVLDNWSRVEDGHSQGIFVNNVGGLRFIESFFDHNGFNSRISSSKQTQFNHNIYINNSKSDLVIDSILSMRASSHGIQARTGGTIQNSIFAYNPIGTYMDNDNSLDQVTNNIYLMGNDIVGVGKHGWGIEIKNSNKTGDEIRVLGNILSQCISTGYCFNYLDNTAKDGGSSVVIQSGNIVLDWAGDLPVSQRAFSDPNRDLEAYEKLVTPEGTNDISDFSSNMRAQSKMNWNSGYQISAIHKWIKAGFDPATPE